MDAIRMIEESFKKEIPLFRIGDTIKVTIKVFEGNKERLQAYIGAVIARKGSGIRETITVRKISGGVGVERILPLHSPIVHSISVVKKGKVRRAKLYYIRDKKGKDAK
ncbi:MAG TPA: 50S ribosomal protein L19, partial [Thermodesulfovibrionia bacterium]|nr:50S ribosomal protein L19 [Thermodesulfovibrionia bacterium]